MCLGINFSFLRCPPLLLSFSLGDTSPCQVTAPFVKLDLTPCHRVWEPGTWLPEQSPRWCIGKCVYVVMSLWSQSWPTGSRRRSESDRWISPSLSLVPLWGGLSLLGPSVYSTGWASLMSDMLRLLAHCEVMTHRVIHCPTRHHVFPFLTSHFPSLSEPWSCPSI